MKYTRILFLTALACLCGCATPARVVDYYDLPSSALVNLRGMTVLPEQVLSNGEYSDLGVVTGFSCRGVRKGAVNFDDSKSRARAVEQLKLNAAAIGAAHVTAPQCVVSEKINMNNNCWTSLTCTGHALVGVTTAL